MKLEAIGATFALLSEFSVFLRLFRLIFVFLRNNNMANCSGHLLRNAVFLAATRCAFPTIACA